MKKSPLDDVLSLDPDGWDAYFAGIDEATIARVSRAATARLKAASISRDFRLVTNLLSVLQYALAAERWIPSFTVASEVLIKVDQIGRLQAPEETLRACTRVQRLLAHAAPDATANGSRQSDVPSWLGIEKGKGQQSRERTWPSEASSSKMGPFRAAGWTQLVDIEKAAHHVLVDSSGDWHQDPWRWPELQLFGKWAHSHISHRLASSYADTPIRIDVEKGGGRTRPAVILSIVDRIAYQSLADVVAPLLRERLPSWVYGWRPSRVMNGHVYADNSTEWRLFQRSLTLQRKATRFVMHLDVADFFSSVGVPRLLEDLRDLLPASAATPVLARLWGFLDSWASTPRRSGLPQRALPSSILAQIELASVDAMLLRRTSTRTGANAIRVCRWMDDYWVFSDDMSALSRVRDEVQDLLLERGLEINSAKTTIWESSDADLDFHINAASGPGSNRASHLSDWDEFAREIQQDPGGIARARIGMLSGRPVTQIPTSCVSLLQANIGRIAHGADYVAKLMRDTKRWSSLEGWYAGQATARFAETYWAVDAWGRMFPSDYPSQGRIAVLFGELLARQAMPSLLLPLAAARCVDWKVGRDAIQAASRQTRNALESRALALATLSSGGSLAEAERTQGLALGGGFLRDFLRSSGLGIPTITVG